VLATHMARAAAFRVVCRFIVSYDAPPKIVLQIYVSLLRWTPGPAVVDEACLHALDLLAAVLPAAWRAGRSLVAETEAPTQRTAYMIASEERFADGRVDRLRSQLDLAVVRIAPVYTRNSTCDNGKLLEPRAMGILAAHRAAWSAVANGSGRALVLESDFSVGNVTNDTLRAKMDAAWLKTDEEFTSVGWCDMCDAPTPSAADAMREGCAACLTGYVIDRDFAARLVEHNPCMAADIIFAAACRDPATEPSGWVRDLQHDIGLEGPANCSFDEAESFHGPVLEGVPVAPPRFRGMFQQDTDRFAGSHQGVPCGQNELTGSSASDDVGCSCDAAKPDDGEATAGNPTTVKCGWRFRSGQWRCLNYPCGTADCDPAACGAVPAGPATEGQIMPPHGGKKPSLGAWLVRAARGEE